MPGGAKPAWREVIDLTGSGVHCNDFHLHFHFPCCGEFKFPKSQNGYSSARRDQRIESRVIREDETDWGYMVIPENAPKPRCRRKSQGETVRRVETEQLDRTRGQRVVHPELSRSLCVNLFFSANSPFLSRLKSPQEGRTSPERTLPSPSSSAPAVSRRRP